MCRYKPLIFLFITTLLCSIASLADAKVQIKTKGIFAHAGDTVTVEVEVLNKFPINGMEFYILLPNCMNIVKNENEISYKSHKIYIDKEEQDAFNGNCDFQVITSEQAYNYYKVLTFSPTAMLFKEDTRTTIKFDISVDNTLHKDETITISGMKIPALMNDSTLAVYSFDDINISVRVAHSTQISNIEPDENNYLYTIDGKRVNKTRRNKIYIHNGKKYLIKD